MPAPRDFVVGPWRAVTVLGVTEILSWGAIFYPPVLTVPLIAADHGWSKAFTMGGFSVGLFVGGLVSRYVGGAIDRYGGHVVMPCGSLIGALGLAGLVVAQSAVAYFAVWMVLGVAMAASLYDPAFATLGRIFGAGARAPITTLTLAGGFASTVGWPATQFLIDKVGWRGTYLVYAALLAVVAAPLHAFALPRQRAQIPAPAAARPEQKAPAAVHSPYGLVFALVATAFAAYAFVPSALSAHLLAIFKRFGLEPDTVVAIGMLFGPAQVLARICELTFARNLNPLWTARFSLGLLVAAFALIALDAVFRPRRRSLCRDVRHGERAHDHRARHRAAVAVRRRRLRASGRADRRAVPGGASGGAGGARLCRRAGVGRGRPDGGCGLRRGRARVLCRDQAGAENLVIAAEHFVDVGLRDVAAVDLEPRAVQILRAVAPRRGRVLDLLEHAGDVVLDEIERRQNFGDALAGQILEIAGLEYLDHKFLDVSWRGLARTCR